MSDDRFDADRAAATIEAVLRQPQGAALVLDSLARIPGVTLLAGRPGGLFRRAEPARLQLGDWHFTALGDGLQVRHVVRGVAVQTDTPAPREAAARLAAELLTSADRHGDDADLETQSALYGLSVIG